MKPRSVRSLFWGAVIFLTAIMSLLTGYTLWGIRQEMIALRASSQEAVALQQRLSALQRLVLKSAIPLGQYIDENNPEHAARFHHLAFLVDVELLHLLRNPLLHRQTAGDLIHLSAQWHEVKALSHIILSENGPDTDATTSHRIKGSGGVSGTGRRLRQVTADSPNLPCALVLLDLDRFKAVNDEHGHPVGDHVLRLVAKVVQSALREDDLPVRYGGEELAVVLPCT